MSQFDLLFTKFILRLREVHILQMSVHADLVAGELHMVRSLLQSYRDLICRYLQGNNIFPVDDVWQEIINVDSIFDCMELNGVSEYALLRYLKQHDLTVQPGEYVGSSGGLGNSSNGGSHFVPIIEVSKKMMSHKDVFVLF
jgi:hypothetical protein